MFSILFQSKHVNSSASHGILQARILEWVAISYSSVTTVKLLKYLDAIIPFPFNCSVNRTPTTRKKKKKLRTRIPQYSSQRELKTMQLVIEQNKDFTHGSSYFNPLLISLGHTACLYTKY